ncbi:MAG: hypothetical protein ACREM1_18275 [Longimicrobiales bacterium]
MTDPEELTTGRRRPGEGTASWDRLVEAIGRSLAATPRGLG